MSDIAIKIENLSKQYRLGNVGTGTLTHDLKSWWATARGKEDPNLQIGLENKLAEKGGDYVYALKDINLEIKKGDIVGVIGKNGAGKSTLLKILSRVTTPTTGSIDLYGRVASLLEVGTGFHPELTGRENIFLNGAIMGMTKQEIRSKFDEIVDFAGVDKYIDTPVKRYSSGMYVRLAFAVAAFLEPEILIVDEVLAVGDMDFQKKAIGKMQDVSNKEGRTVLFVSHNMGAIARLCNKGLLMKHGQIKEFGQVNNIIQEYLNEKAQISSIYNSIEDQTKPVQIISVKMLNSEGQLTETFVVNEDVGIEIIIKNKSLERRIRCNIGVWDLHDNLISVDRINLTYSESLLKFSGKLKGTLLIPNRYKFTVSLDIPNYKVIELMQKPIYFELLDNIGSDLTINGDIENGMLKSQIRWVEN
jgi:lipopolysaccharide transport system ATP-binding protein